MGMETDVKDEQKSYWLGHLDLLSLLNTYLSSFLPLLGRRESLILR